MTGTVILKNVRKRCTSTPFENDVLVLMKHQVCFIDRKSLKEKWGKKGYGSGDTGIFRDLPV